MRTVRRAVQFAVGVTTALAVPLYLRGQRFASLLEEPSEGFERAVAYPDFAVRSNRWAIQRLARLPFWKNTCLYRSVGECLVLRAYGQPVIVRLGVRAGDRPASVAAHAWVERPGGSATPDMDTYRPLVSSKQPG